MLIFLLSFLKIGATIEVGFEFNMSLAQSCSFCLEPVFTVLKFSHRSDRSFQEGTEGSRVVPKTDFVVSSLFIQVSSKKKTMFLSCWQD